MEFRLYSIQVCIVENYPRLYERQDLSFKSEIRLGTWRDRSYIVQGHG